MKQPKTTAKRIWPACFAMLLFFAACADKGLEIQVRFDKAEGLGAGNGVIFENRNIGTVEKVVLDPDGKYRVDLVIQPDFANAADTETLFVIQPDPENQKPAVWLVRGRQKGTALKDGDVVRGSDRLSSFFSKLQRKMDKGLSGLSAIAEGFVRDLDRLAGKDRLQKLEKTLDQMAKELARSGKQARDRFQKEVLPKLREKVEELQKRLKELGREKEAEPLKRRLEDLQTI